MAETTEGRVAVYIDFDNIVISRYDQVHGRGHFKRDNVRAYLATGAGRNSEEGARVEQAGVDLGSILDYASSFGTIAISRAYADWSVPVNANYQDQLVGRAVELVQMFPTVRSMKNGADIRMSVDVVEDLFRLPELTHVVIVSGDSDFIALAQRCRRLGRYVVGIGVAGGTSRALNAACNEYKDYDGLPGLDDAEAELDAEPLDDVAMASDTTRIAGGGGSTEATPEGSTSARSGTSARGRSGASTGTSPTDAPAGQRKGAKATTASAGRTGQRATPKPAEQRAATSLLRRALELGQTKDQDWVTSSSVKSQMLRMDPTFQESALGYATFTDFLRSRGNVVELKEDAQARRVRLRAAGDTAK